MTRVQILLTENQDHRLEALARRVGISKSALARESLEIFLQSWESRGSDPLLELVGQAGKVRRRDAARRHDRVLGNAKLKRGRRFSAGD